MSRYRILRRSGFDDDYFVVQARVLWFWHENPFLPRLKTIEQAREYLRGLERLSTPDVVVEEQ